MKLLGRVVRLDDEHDHQAAVETGQTVQTVYLISTVRLSGGYSIAGWFDRQKRSDYSLITATKVLALSLDLVEMAKQYDGWSGAQELQAVVAENTDRAHALVRLLNSRACALRHRAKPPKTRRV